MPLPVCRPKRGQWYSFPGARWGYGTQADVYVYKLNAWVTPSGDIVQYLTRSANLHDTTVSDELNRQWPDFVRPRIIGDKGYCCLGDVFLPKSTTRYVTGWRPGRHSRLRKRIETMFSGLVKAQIRSMQTKTLRSLRLRVVPAVLAHNLAQPETGSSVDLTPSVSERMSRRSATGTRTTAPPAQYGGRGDLGQASAAGGSAGGSARLPAFCQKYTAAIRASAARFQRMWVGMIRISAATSSSSA